MTYERALLGCSRREFSNEGPELISFYRLIYDQFFYVILRRSHRCALLLITHDRWVSLVPVHRARVDDSSPLYQHG